MATAERRPSPESATGLGRRHTDKWSHRSQRTSYRHGLSWVLHHSTTPVFVVGWTVLCIVIYVAFAADQARSGSWGCQLPRMFPVYRRLEPPIPGSRYDTFLYREGGWDPETPVGSPVIFLPGHAGDYKQARSVASSLARQFYGDEHSINYEQPYWARPVDVWAVHYNEDFTAIHAPTLLDQAKYLVSVIPKVLDAYQHLPVQQRPTTVTVLGHSMGGVVARLATRLRSELPIDAIITIATPHRLPPANLEFGMEQLYAKINVPASNGDREPILVSICGGAADTQIVSESCTLPGSVGPNDGFAVFSSGVPATWTNVEHQAIVWCDQVRWRIARILLDMRSVSTREAKLSAARKWLRGSTVLDAASPPHDRLKELLPVVHDDMTYVVQLRNPTPTQLAEPPFSLFSCDPTLSCQQISATARLIPYPDDPRLPFPLPGEGVRDRESAFALSVKNVDPRGAVRIGSDEEFNVLSAGAHTQLQADSGKWTRISEALNSTHLSIHFPSALVSSLVAWRLQFRSPSCSGRPPVVHFLGRPLRTEYLNEESRFYVGFNTPITLHSHISGAPFQGQDQYSFGLDVDVYQQPECAVEQVYLKLDILATIAKSSLRLRVACVTWSIVWATAIIYRQLSGYTASDIAPSVAGVISADVPRSLLLATVVSVVTMALQGLIPKTTPTLLIGAAHWHFIPLAAGLAVFSLGLTIAVAGVLSVAIRFGSAAIGSTGRTMSSGDSTVTIKTRAVFGAMLLLLVKLVIPVGIAFIALYLILFASVCRSASCDQRSRHRILFSCLLLMTLLLPFHGLSLAVWGRNVWAEIGHPFDEDHAVLPLIPVLLFVEQSTRETTLLTKDTRIMRAAKLGSALLAAVSFLLGPRRPFLLPTAASVLFLAMTAVLGGLERLRSDYS